MTEARPYVIAVGGVPGAGKTALARDLADTLHLPALVRDEIKEGMHVTARSDDPAEVRRFADASFAVFWRTVQDLARAGVSLVAEAAFHRDRAAADLAVTAALADVVLVWCRVEPAVALARYRARAPLRHPAHADGVNAERMGHPAFDWSVYEPPAGPWPLVAVDTTARITTTALTDLCRRLDGLRTPPA